MVSVDFCFFTLNEARGCEEQLPIIKELHLSRLFAVDGGSTDDTKEILINSSIQFYEQEYPSYNGAYRKAFELSTADYLVVFHPKGTIDPNTLIQMENLLLKGHDLVVGSRMLKESRNEEDDRYFRPRKWFSQMLAVTCKWRYGRTSNYFISDPLHGYRGFSKRFINSMNLNSTGVTADLEQVIYCYRSGFSYAEFSVIEKKRPHGKTNFPALRTGWALVRLVFKSNYSNQHKQTN